MKISDFDLIVKDEILGIYKDIFLLIEEAEVEGNNGNLELSMSKFSDAHKLFLERVDNSEAKSMSSLICLWNIFDGIGKNFANAGMKDDAIYHLNMALDIASSMGLYSEELNNNVSRMCIEKTTASLDVVNNKLQ